MLLEVLLRVGNALHRILPEVLGLVPILSHRLPIHGAKGIRLHPCFGCDVTRRRLARVRFALANAVRWIHGPGMRQLAASMTIAALSASTLAAEDGMTEQLAAGYVKMALAGIDREYPNKPGGVWRGPQDVRSPRVTHPVFYGHYDWHSSVHGHWTLLRLLRRYPTAAFAPEVRRVLDGRFTPEGLAAEAAYFHIKENQSFERMYGWAWALRLGQELRAWDDPDARRWAGSFLPLEQEIVRLAKAYLPNLDWPVRCGFHPETAFPLAQMLDWARAAPDQALETLVLARAKRFYGGDRDYPTAYEPSGNDFFSPGLNVADLMRRVLPPAEFGAWLDGYLPGLAAGRAGHLLEPVRVSDPTDPQLIHLAGLNLSRAWTLRGIAAALPESDPRRDVLLGAATAHATQGLAMVATGHYEGEHWLATFAVYLLTGD